MATGLRCSTPAGYRSLIVERGNVLSCHEEEFGSIVMIVELLFVVLRHGMLSLCMYSFTVLTPHECILCRVDHQKMVCGI